MKANGKLIMMVIVCITIAGIMFGSGIFLGIKVTEHKYKPKIELLNKMKSLIEQSMQ